MKKLLVIATLFLATVIVLGETTKPDSPSRSTARPASSAGPADQATLQQDANMTQQMSVGGANGPMQRYGTPDPQLTHSQNPAFVRQLEQYQAQIDQMLARPTP